MSALEAGPTPAKVRVLVVDDAASTRAIHRGILDKSFEVQTAASGDEALALCETQMPDLVLLDVEMPGMNGFEVCSRLRKLSDIPIIFATAHDGVDEHLKAYDAGGDDIFVKPVSAELLMRKVGMAVAAHRERVQLVHDKESLAATFRTAVHDIGALLEFTRTGLACPSHDALARQLVASAQRLGLICCVALRHDGQETVYTARGAATELERSVLSGMTGMGRVFQFKSRLVFNCAKASILVSNMPDADSENADRMREHVQVLAETAEILSENVSMRREAAESAEALQITMQTALQNGVDAVDSLQAKHLRMISDVSYLLQELAHSVETNYAWLASDRQQEDEITRPLHRVIETILDRLAAGTQFSNALNQVSANLQGQSTDDVEFF